MISHAFPPAGGVGVQRSAKFAKYLPDFGWQPVVWSAGRIRNLPYDPEQLSDVGPGLIHYPSGAVEDPTENRRLTEALARSGLGDWWCYRAVPGMKWRLRRVIDTMASHLVPDDRVGWALRSVRPLLKIIRNEQVDVIYSTYSPASNHLLAGWLKQLTGLPWVSDYRDLWIDDYCYPSHGPIRRWADRMMQQRMLEQADAVIGVNQEQADVLASHVPSQQDKFCAVPNGVDLADFDRIDRHEARRRLHGPGDRFVLTFTGQFTSRRVSDALFDGLGRFAESVQQRGGRFEMRVVGGISQEMQNRFRASGVPLVTTGFLPHGQAIEHMVSADALLLLTPTGHNAATLATGKVYEYLAAGRPILLVGPGDSVVRQLLDRFGMGFCAIPESDQVLDTLETLWKAWKDDALPDRFRPEELRPFTRKQLAGQLARILEHVRSPNPE
jgi:glycosyltransferase involved in cell wall biosynthesis